MSKYWVDFSASVLIEAETAKEAEKLFWNSNYGELHIDEIQIDGIEEVEND